MRPLTHSSTQLRTRLVHAVIHWELELWELELWELELWEPELWGLGSGNVSNKRDSARPTVGVPAGGTSRC